MNKCRCGAPIHPAHNYCPACSAALLLECPACGEMEPVKYVQKNICRKKAIEIRKTYFPEKSVRPIIMGFILLFAPIIIFAFSQDANILSDQALSILLLFGEILTVGYLLSVMYRDFMQDRKNERRYAAEHPTESALINENEE